MIAPTTLLQDRYRIERLLGTGGFARVYLAHDERLQRFVAIKELSAEKLEEHDRPMALRLFAQEARILAQLDHAGLTKVWDYFQHEDRAFLVMEYVPGPTLRELVLAHGAPFPDALTVACGLCLCDVFQYLHQHQPPIIFRDLKPGNVIIESHRAVEEMPTDPASLQLKLIDFGIARLFKPEQSADTMIVGTPGYAAPEQYGHGQTDTRSDIYSLGATLHHLASGQPPAGLFLPGLPEIRPDVTPALARVVARATALKPEERYQSIDQLRRDLQAVASAPYYPATTARLTPRPTVPLQPSTQPPPQPASSMPAMLVLIVVVIVGAIGGAGALIAAWGGQRPAGGATLPSGESPTASVGIPLLPGATGTLLYGQYAEDVFSCDIYWVEASSRSYAKLLGGGRSTAAALAPDKLRFATVEGNIVYMRSLSGERIGQISDDGKFARYPVFSPDGHQLAYTEATARSGAYRLVIVDLDTGEHRYPGPSNLGWIAWSSQGITYAAPARPGAPQDIFVLRADGTARNLTNTPAIEEDFPSWSHDGATLLFTASTPGDLNSRQIYRADADGGHRTQLTRSAGPHTNAALSPDGNWVAYVSRAAGGRFQLWAMRADGSDPHQLMAGSEGQFYIRWEK